MSTDCQKWWWILVNICQRRPVVIIPSTPINIYSNLREFIFKSNVSDLSTFSSLPQLLKTYFYYKYSRDSQNIRIYEKQKYQKHMSFANKFSVFNEICSMIMNIYFHVIPSCKISFIIRENRKIFLPKIDKGSIICFCYNLMCHSIKRIRNSFERKLDTSGTNGY